MQEERKKYLYQNRAIYEWDQSLDTVYCYIQLPPLPQNIKPKSILEVSITPKQLTVGFKNTPPYLKHDFEGIVDAEESVWYIEQKKQNKNAKQIVIELHKAQKGVRWGCVFKGHGSLNILQQENLKKKLLLQRFQEENPGFDFSSAQFNGQVPQARTFLGGPKG